MPRTKTGRTVLCKPAESKCTQKSFMQQFTNEMPQTKAGTTVLREPAQSKYTWTYEKKIRKNSQVKCRRPRDWDNRFPRACVVRIHLDINFMRKLSSQMLQTKDRDSEPAQSTCTWTSEKQFYAKMFKRNAADQYQGKLAAQTLRERAQSKCPWTCRKNRFAR